ncbi:60S ribosomal protein L19 [Saguinus oedipus]|uniref:Large ribosomal subunit protein eL19 n=1 Tax=Saguinus oedipus TaxID=9490 RepID=A0ABQ9UAW2_SAGOE|nr:60S ribosomal protein L19 [Saguinus oedipus]
MRMLRLQKRLTTSALHCSKKVWLNPNEANSHQQIQKLTEVGLIIGKPVTVHSGSTPEKHLGLLEGQAHGHRLVKAHSQCPNAREDHLDEENEDSVSAARKILSI